MECESVSRRSTDTSSAADVNSALELDRNVGVVVQYRLYFVAPATRAGDACRLEHG